MAFNRETRKVPALRAVCRSGDAVREVINWARDTGKRFAVHSSGHCFAGHSMHDELVIDTRYLNGIRFDADQKRVTVGASAFIGHVYERLAASRQGLGGGTYGSVCMAGQTLGGGIGYLARSAGLLCDQLEEITVVDAGGRIMRASQDENADLFWASRGGGGGSFAIATEMTFRTKPVPERTIIYLFIAVSFEQARRIVHDWQLWSSDIGLETTTHLLLSRRSKRQYLVSLTGE
ncbi:MAG: FAD-binding oxidoreductase, partial [Candidatus Tectomicrobia bacterium]|nr:FAD-binding oxidoreductase [Candidatus Tectomicrobia bacterium]